MDKMREIITADDFKENNKNKLFVESWGVRKKSLDDQAVAWSKAKRELVKEG